MKAKYKIVLGPNEDPKSNKKVQALMKMFDPGCKWTLKVHEKPLKLKSTSEGVIGGCGQPIYYPEFTYHRWVEINASGGTPRKVLQPKPTQAMVAPLSLKQLDQRLKDHWKYPEVEKDYWEELRMLAIAREIT